LEASLQHYLNNGGAKRTTGLRDFATLGDFFQKINVANVR